MIIKAESKIIICPKCNGEGKVEERTSLHDSEHEECTYCKGERVVKEIITIEHKSII